MFDLSINPPLYQYTFSIDSSALGPVNNSNPGRVPQYEVTQQTGANSLLGWPPVAQTHGSFQ
jgi:hypothetical protein